MNRVPLVILGAGGHGRELLDVVEVVNEGDPIYDFLGFLDDTGGNDEIVARRDTSVLGPIERLSSLHSFYLIGLGSGADRRRIDKMVAAWGREAATLVHPLAALGSDLELGPGCVIMAGARVTTNVRLGRHTHVNVNSTVSHDCRVGSYVTVNPGANVNGNVELSDGVTVGSGAVVREKVSIGPGTTIGAGAVVLSDLPGGVTAVGIPARPLPR